MGFIDNVKAFGSNLATTAAGIAGRMNSPGGFSVAHQVVTGYGCGPRSDPFSQAAAMRQFQHWAYAAAMLNANAVANVPLRLYARHRRGKKSYYETRKVDTATRSALKGSFENRPSNSIRRKVAEFADDLVEVVEPHPALKVLDIVNQWQNGYELTVLRMLDLQITGNAYIYPVLSEVGVPAELLRLPPQHTEIIPGENKFIDFYRYNGVNPWEIPPEEIIHFRLPNPADLYYGRGWVEAAWSALALHGAKRGMDLAVFQNMARPDYLLAMKTGGTPGQLDKLEKKIEKGNRGANNAGRFLTLTGDVSVTPLNWNTTGADQVGTATRIIEEISAVSGVPVAMLLSNDPTKATSVSARLGWYRNTIQPLCRLDEEKLNEKHLSRFDGSEDMFLAYDSVSFEDAEALSKRIIGEVAGGVRQVNEGRVALGLPAMPDMDILYPPSGSTGAAAGLVGDLATRPAGGPPVGGGSGGKDED